MTADPDGADDAAIAARQRWMGVLARALPDEIESAWMGLAHRPRYEFLRRPEIGLLMVQGRMGGDGRAFNVGEVTVTRCTVRLDRGHPAPGPVGHAVVLGRATRHAELAAALDAMMQNEESGAALEQAVIARLAMAQSRRRDQMARKAAATRVEFFTMVRGAL